MAKNEKPKSEFRQSGQYDKIIKENLEATLPVIIKDVLGLNIVESEELPDDLLHTKERKPDALKKITDADGNTYVLQVEFQVKDEADMVYRMAEYYIMLLRRYRLPVKQYVVFLGEEMPGMPLHLSTEHLNFNFTLVSLSNADFRLFLKSDNPEVKMLGLLANFGKLDSFTAVKEIIEQVKSFAKGDFAESRYFKQLRIFVQLRDYLQPQLEQIMETISTFYKEEKDFLYRKGEQKGEFKKAIAIAKELKKRKLSLNEIALITGLPITEIKKL